MRSEGAAHLSAWSPTAVGHEQTFWLITFSLINSANGVAERQGIQEDGREHDRNKNPVGNPISGDRQDGTNDQDRNSTRVVKRPQGITEYYWTE